MRMRGREGVAYHRKQFMKLKRLREKSSSAAILPVALAIHVGPAGNNYRDVRGVGIAFESQESVKAIEARQPFVTQNHRRDFALRHGQAFLAIISYENVESGASEKEFEYKSDVRVVIHNQNRFRILRHVGHYTPRSSTCNEVFNLKAMTGGYLAIALRFTFQTDLAFMRK